MEVLRAPGETLSWIFAPSLVRVTKPLLTPAQEAAGPEDAAVALLGLLPVEKFLRAPLLRERGLLLLHLYLFLRLGDVRFLELLRLVLSRGRFDLGFFGGSFFLLPSEGSHVFGAQHLRPLLFGEGRLFLCLGLFGHDVRGGKLFLAYGLFGDYGLCLDERGGLRIHLTDLRREDDLLFGLGDLLLRDGEIGVRVFALVLGRHTDVRIFRGPGLLLGGLMDHGDGLGVEPL